jgi:hypothetical protein
VSTPDLVFDHDKIDHKKTAIPVPHIEADVKKLDTELLKSRTNKNNAAQKEAELDKFSLIKNKLADIVDNHIKDMSLRPKWGTGSEGIVVHPPKSNPDAPRFKVTSDTFRQYKADPNNKLKFKERNVNV